MHKALLVDDDQELTRLLVEYLKRFQFEALAAASPSVALDLFEKWQPDVIVLDVMLPEMNGFEVCKALRKTSSVPIVMLTARTEVVDRVLGLEIGADDYLPKPFEPRELAARLQAVLRRGKTKNFAQNIRCGELLVQVNRQWVTLKGEQLSLTTAEFKLLLLFLQNPNQVLTREDIFQQHSKITWESFDRTVDVLVSRLRQKLGDHSKKPKYLKTIWGTGYLWIHELDE